MRVEPLRGVNGGEQLADERCCEGASCLQRRLDPFHWRKIAATPIGQLRRYGRGHAVSIVKAEIIVDYGKFVL